MSQLADINRTFKEAIEAGVGSEEALLRLKLGVLEALEWHDDARDVADELANKGYKVEYF